MLNITDIVPEIAHSLEISVPVPATLLATLWFLLAVAIGQGFKDIDGDLQGTDWFTRRCLLTQWCLKRLFDLFHHWWMGLFMVVYAIE